MKIACSSGRFHYFIYSISARCASSGWDLTPIFLIFLLKCGSAVLSDSLSPVKHFIFKYLTQELSKRTGLKKNSSTRRRLWLEDVSLPLTSQLFLNSQRRAAKLSIRLPGNSIQFSSTRGWQHNHADPASGGEVVQTYNNERSTNLNFLSQQQIKSYGFVTHLLGFVALKCFFGLFSLILLMHKSEVRFLERL